MLGTVGDEEVGIFLRITTADFVWPDALLSTIQVEITLTVVRTTLVEKSADPVVAPGLFLRHHRVFAGPGVWL